MEMNSGWFSAAELASLKALGLIGVPGTERGCTIKAKRENWPSKAIQGKGGKGGVKTLYRPPDTVLAAIATLDKIPSKSTAHTVEQPSTLLAYAEAAKSTEDLSPDLSMLEVLLRVAEYKIKEPMTVDLADKIERVVVAWMPVATGRPDLAARLDRLQTAVALLRPD
ncbi:MAG: hypothetical protein PHQ05_10300 [Sterolibacterium sp.]|nr:hypothetical protein [Sterolibacterium sp.]